MARTEGEIMRGEPAYAVCRCGNWEMDHDEQGRAQVALIPNTSHRYEFYEYRHRLVSGRGPDWLTEPDLDDAAAALLAKLPKYQMVQFLGDSATAHHLRGLLVDWVPSSDAAALLADLLRASRRLEQINTRLREQLQTRTDALDRKMDLAVEAELEIRRTTVQEAIKPFVARAEAAEASFRDAEARAK